jgi:hypothetical protein
MQSASPSRSGEGSGDGIPDVRPLTSNLNPHGGKHPGRCSVSFPIDSRLASLPLCVPGDRGKMGSPQDRSLCQQCLQAVPTLLQLGRFRQPRRSRRSIPEVGLPSRIRLSSDRSPQESGKKTGDVERLLHPGFSPLGSPDVAGIAFDAEGPEGSTPAFHRRLSDGSDDGQAAPDPSQPPSSRLEDLWRINSLLDPPGNTKDIFKAGWRQFTYQLSDSSMLRPLQDAISGCGAWKWNKRFLLFLNKKNF